MYNKAHQMYLKAQQMYRKAQQMYLKAQQMYRNAQQMYPNITLHSASAVKLMNVRTVNRTGHRTVTLFHFSLSAAVYVFT
jgi:hypothetical protein